MKKLVIFLTAMLISGFVLSGCGSSEEKESKEPKQEKAKADSSDKAEKKESKEKEEETTEEKTESDSGEASANYEKLNKDIEKKTEGKTKVIFTNTDKQEHKLGELTTTLESYELVELKDFHADFDIPFDRETDGGVLVAKYNIHNGSDKDMYYMPSFSIQYTGAERFRSNYRELLPEDEQIATKLTHDDGYLIKAGETVSGYEAYPFGQKALDEVLDLSTVTVIVPVALSKKDDFSSSVGSEGKFHLSLNDEGEKKVKQNASFYKDKVTEDNMGDKEMLKAKENISKKEKLGDSGITLDGYQFTKFTPNKEEAPRFKSFNNGIVLLTVKFTIDNKGKQEIGTSSVGSTLHMNDGSQYTINEGMLLNRKYSDGIKPGESKEFLQVYTIGEEEYEKILKNKSFEVELGPLLDKDAKDISKGRKAEFNLPK